LEPDNITYFGMTHRSPHIVAAIVSQGLFSLGPFARITGWRSNCSISTKVR